jgi:alpha-mannosidase
VRKFQTSTFTQDIRLSAKLPWVDIVTTADWHEKHILIKAAFPLSVQSRSATYEIPYGSIPRPTTRLTPEEKAKFEVPALRWADLSDGQYGVSILNESKYGYDGRDNVLRLSLLRSPSYPDPHADEGVHRFEYAIYPHAGGWQAAGTVRRGYEFNYRMIPVQVSSHAGELPPMHSFLSVAPENLVLTALKQSESGEGLILRFYESNGAATAEARIQLPPGATSAWETNLMETREKEIPLANGAIRLPVRPYEIRTIEVLFGTTGKPTAATGAQP